MAWRVSRFGDPYGNGFMNWDAGLVPKVAIADNLYSAYSGYLNAPSGTRGKWTESNKDSWNLITRVKKIRRELIK